MGFSSLQARVQGAQSFPRTGAARPGRGGCVDSLSLLMEKAHNVSSVRRPTLEASQRRTKLSQSSCPPWVSGLSSGFIKLLRKKGHIRAGLSRKSCGGLARRPPAVTAEKVCIVHSVCVGVCEYMCVDRGAGLGQKAQTGSPGRNTRWELHTMVRSLR